MTGAQAVLETPTGHAAGDGDRELEQRLGELRAAVSGLSPAALSALVATAPLEPHLAEVLQLPPSSGLVRARRPCTPVSGGGTGC